MFKFSQSLQADIEKKKTKNYILITKKALMKKKISPLSPIINPATEVKMK